MAASTLTTYAQALTSAIGVPAHILDINMEDEGYPPFQFWFYHPPSKVSFEDTVVYTVGLANSSQGGACPYVELFFQFTGKYPVEQLNNLAQILGGLVHETRKRVRFTPNTLIRNLPIELLPGMRDVMVQEGAGRRALWVELQDRTVRVLSLIALYPQEANWCATKSGFNTYHAFLNQGIDFLKPRRQQLTDFPVEPTGRQLARICDLSQSTDPPSPDELWDEVRSWYELNAPNIAKKQTPDLYQTLENLGESLGVTLPEFPEDIPHVQAQFTFLVTHWEMIYSGAYEPGPAGKLKANPNFIPPVQSFLKV